MSLSARPADKPFSIKSAYELFEYDWNDYTVTTDDKKVEELSKLALAVKPNSDKERQMLGEILYKAGTYYNHSKCMPEAALPHLLKAKEYLANPNELAWVDNHIAFSYQQKAFAANKASDSKVAEENIKKSLNICNELVKSDPKELKDKEAIKIWAFASCVKALTEYENGQLEQAIKSYKTALDLYENHKLLDNQFARAKNRWAMMLLENGLVDAAATAYKELDAYWEKNNGLTEDDPNSYSASFYEPYGDFLMQKGKHQNIQEAYFKYSYAHAVLSETEPGKEQSEAAIRVRAKKQNAKEELEKVSSKEHKNEKGVKSTADMMQVMPQTSPASLPKGRSQDHVRPLPTEVPAKNQTLPNDAAPTPSSDGISTAMGCRR